MNQDEHDALKAGKENSWASSRYDGTPIDFAVDEKGHYYVVPDEGVSIISFLLLDQLGQPVDRNKPRKRPR